MRGRTGLPLSMPEVQARGSGPGKGEVSRAYGAPCSWLKKYLELAAIASRACDGDGSRGPKSRSDDSDLSHVGRGMDSCFCRRCEVTIPSA